jgi:hypothetical protein
MDWQYGDSLSTRRTEFDLFNDIRPALAREDLRGLQ